MVIIHDFPIFKALFLTDKQGYGSTSNTLLLLMFLYWYENILLWLRHTHRHTHLLPVFIDCISLLQEVLNY